MRDPFAGYDSWLEQPYQDECARGELEEWIAENTLFYSECCHAEVIDADTDGFVWDLYEAGTDVICPKCQQPALLVKEEPEKHEPDPPEPDDYYPD